MQGKPIFLIEDGNWRDLAPVTDLRPTALVPVGAFTLLDRVKRAFPGSNVALIPRPELASVLASADGPVASVGPVGPGLYINARCLGTPDLFQLVTTLASGSDMAVLCQGDTVLAAYFPPRHTALAALDRQIPDWSQVRSSDLRRVLSQWVTPIEVSGVPIVDAIWDFPGLLETGIRLDATQYPLGTIFGAVAPHVATYDSSAIHVAAGAKVEPFVVLDARSGPIIIDADAVIESHSRIDGPAYIGPNTRVLGGRIRGCAIGAHCKVSGEMSQTLMGAYSNKSHDGFWGNSYIGQWVNIGANSVTSNLKNTYGSVTLVVQGQLVPTPTQFLGAIVGDHARFGIGTHLTTGTIVGTGACITGTAVHAKSIPRFAWGSSGQYGVARLAETLTTIKRMMARRQYDMAPEYETIVTQLHPDGAPHP